VVGQRLLCLRAHYWPCRVVAGPRILHAFQHPHRDTTFLRACPPARGLRAAKPPVGGSRSTGATSATRRTSPAQRRRTSASPRPAPAPVNRASGARSSPFAADITCRRSAQDAVQRTGATGSSSRSRFGSRNRSQDTHRAPIPPTSAKSSRVAGLNCLRSSNSIQAAAENSCADRRGQISVRVEEIGLGGSGELVRVTRDFKRIRESLCRLQAPAGLNRKTIVAP
jgi:hypothetical protein